MLLTQISMKKKKKKKKNYLLSDILVYSSLRNLVGKEYCSSCSVYMFLCRKKPCLPWGVGCFCLCCHPRPAIGACGYIVMSGPWAVVWGVLPTFPPSQPGTSHPLEEASFSFLWCKAEGAPPPMTPPSGARRAHASMSLPPGLPTRGPLLPTVLYRSRVNRMSLSPCPQRAGQGLPANLAPSVLHDQVTIGGLCYPGPLLPPTLPSGTEWALFCELTTCGNVTN